MMNKMGLLKQLSLMAIARISMGPEAWSMKVTASEAP
jgi:hypothetical protein